MSHDPPLSPTPPVPRLVPADAGMLYAASRPREPLPPTDDERSSCRDGDAAMEAFARGDVDAFLRLHRAVHPRLAGFVRRRCADPVTADDVLQDTWKRVIEKRGVFLPGARVMPWVCAIARNLCADDRRRRSRTPVGIEELGDLPDDLAPTGYDHVEAGRARRALERAVAALPQAQREVYICVKIEEMTLVEVAELTGGTIPGVKSLSFRAAEAVRAALVAEFGEPR